MNDQKEDQKDDQKDDHKLYIKLQNLMEKAVEFHGHACPGLAIGVVASDVALENAKRAEDEELVAIVENDACGVDAIQALTGCTYGKGNLIHKDYGKSVYTFFNRDTGQAIRLSLKSEIFSQDGKENKQELFEKIRNGTATEEESAEYNGLRKEHIRSILRAGEKIFNIKEIEMRPPEKARIFDNFLCENCGESTMMVRVCEMDGKKFCIPCCKEFEMEREIN